MNIPPDDEHTLGAPRIDYVVKVLQCLFFLLAVPYLILRLLTDPKGTMRAATATHAAG